jgi:hypothetical protein
MNIQRLTLIAAFSSMVAACGGGGSDTASASAPSPAPMPASPPPAPAASPATTVPAGTTQATSTYVSGSVESAILSRVNIYRARCGFPTLAQNTILDAAGKAHTDYMRLNNFQVTDTEVVDSPGFTGITADDRAQAKGWPMGLYAATQAPAQSRRCRPTQNTVL